MSIVFQDICFTYFEDRKDVVSHWSAEFPKSEITVLTGPSGCGKSTLLYLAAGIYPHTTGVLRGGSILVEGQDPAALAPQQRCALVGMMFQDPELQFCMDTVRNELIFCLENVHTDPADLEHQLDEALAFCGVEHLKQRPLHSLSGGEKQRIALACLVALHPRWLLLDEPFANIDDPSARDIALRLKRLHDERGVGILAVDHRLDNWLQVADTLQIFRPEEQSVQRMETAHLDPETLKELGVIVPGQTYAPQLAPAAPGQPVLELRDLSLTHEDDPVLQHVNAAFLRGGIYAVVGQSGCGKSSLFGALSGLYRYSGQALLDGKEVRRLKGRELGRMGFVTQDPQDQFVGGSVRDEIAISLRNDPDVDTKTEEILRGIRLWRYRDISPYLLSQGQQRRLGVAALMAYNCQVLVCDEPTYAQDRRNAMAIMDALCRQAREHQIALIFSTHDRQLAFDYADQVLELKRGQLCALV